VQQFSTLKNDAACDERFWESKNELQGIPQTSSDGKKKDKAKPSLSGGGSHLYRRRGRLERKGCRGQEFSKEKTAPTHSRKNPRLWGRKKKTKQGEIT